MALDVNEWKRILDQPKNLGLKALGGTGLSQTLVKFRAAYDLYVATQTAEHLNAATEDVVKKTKEIVDKHSKLYTTACNYLKQVNQQAIAVKNELQKERVNLQNWEHFREEARTKQNEVMSACGVAEQEVKGTKNQQELNAAWVKFKNNYKTKVAAYYQCKLSLRDGMKDAMQQVDSFDSAGFNPFELARLRTSELLRRLWSEANGVPRAEAFGQG
jgi:hypothetical protein